VTDPALEASHRIFESSFQARLPGRDANAFALLTYTLGAGRRAEALVADVVRSHGLDGSQTSALIVLWMTGPPHRVSPTALSRTLSQSPSGMTHTIKRLTTAGLVSRVGVASDGRAKHVELTDRGVEVVRSCVEALSEAADRVFATSEEPVGELTGAQLEVVACLVRHLSG
jgi:DNA-binding MarR family transcriptional regulator